LRIPAVDTEFDAVTKKTYVPKTDQSEPKEEFNDVTDEDDGDYDSYLSDDDGPNFILYQWRWVNLFFYFLGLTTSGFNMVCFSSVGPQVGRAYGFMTDRPPQPPREGMLFDVP